MRANKTIAYELFLKNLKNTNESTKTIVPIKKIYVEVKEVPLIQLDPKTLEEYGDSANGIVFRELLSMPLNYLKSTDLPFRSTGSASKKPYITLYSSIIGSKLKITIQGEKKSSYEYSFDFEKNQERQKTTGQTPLVLRLDNSKYFVQNETLHETYRQAKIINENNELSQNLFATVCKAFVNLCKEKQIQEMSKNAKGTFRFNIVILPYIIYSKGLSIKYQTCKEEPDASICKEFKDAFGNSAAQYASKTTINAKFMSCDDQAFTINCCTGKDFYANLGIGDASFSKINLPAENEFRISGLKWYFLDIADPSFKFEEAKSGFYDQLLLNYKLLLKHKANSPARASAMKIICAKESQAKLEILLDENLAFDRLKKLFDPTDSLPQRHPMVFETLIIQRTNGPIWADYLIGIKSYLTGKSIERHVLLRRYLITLKESYLQDWIKGIEKRKGDKKAFFTNAEFCLKLLTMEGKKGGTMNINEKYAYKIGKIAGKYVKFKKDSKETNNSTNDILTYTKYDREKLRHVYKRICIGVNLSKTNAASQNEVSTFIKENTPAEEIDDSKTNEDYSYFFYKGVFENL